MEGVAIPFPVPIQFFVVEWATCCYKSHVLLLREWWLPAEVSIHRSRLLRWWSVAGWRLTTYTLVPVSVFTRSRFCLSCQVIFARDRNRKPVIYLPTRLHWRRRRNRIEGRDSDHIIIYDTTGMEEVQISEIGKGPYWVVVVVDVFGRTRVALRSP